MDELIKYIESLESESFIGWTEDEKKGYLTACTSIKEKVKQISSKKNLAFDTLNMLNLFDIDPNENQEDK